MVGKTKGRKEEVVNREYTINLHKRLHGWSEAEPVSKADKKFEKKLEFYAKIRDTVAALGANKDIKKKKKLRSRQKKLKPYDLSNLSEFLPDLKPQEQPPPVDDVKLNPKNMQKLILKEGHRMTTVLNHHAFKSDPLGAIHQHLLSTQPVVNDNPKKELKKKTKTKRKKAKASSGAQSMDI